MEKEMIGTGRTYNDAVEDACQKLGVDPEYVDYEVLERPRTALFGLKHIPAKVKVTIKEEYEKKFAPQPQPQAEARPQRPAQQPKAQKPQQERPQQERSQQEPRQKKQGERQPQAPKEQRPQQERPQQEPRQKKQNDRPKKERPQQTPPVKEPAVQREAPRQSEAVKEIAPEVLEAKGQVAAEYIGQVLTAMGYPEARVTAGQKEGMIALQLEGEGLGAVVGRRGDNLDAMQYLASLVANRADGGYCRVVLDVDEYRSKREASLQAYARKMASQAVRSGRSTTLEPMNPYERRIVHSAVQTVEGATSRSVGSEPNRRVVISSASGRPSEGAERYNDRPAERDGAQGGDDRRRDGNRDGNREGYRGGRDGNRDGYRGGRDGGRGGRGGRGDRDRRDSQKVILPPSNEPPKSDDPGISLYGKIEL